VTSARLRALFAELNRMFWNGRLPLHRVRRKQLPNHRGLIDTTRRIIWLDSRPERVGDVRRVLLHEMCHIPQGCSGHGKLFRRQLQRLATRGETWADEELQVYADTPPPTRISAKRVRDYMNLLANMTQDFSVHSWRTARRGIADGYGLTVTEVSRRYPTARSWWLAAKQRELERRRAKPPGPTT
jgi:hypothetical protein